MYSSLHSIGNKGTFAPGVIFSFEQVIFEIQGDIIISLSGENVIYHLSNRKSNVGVNINQFLGSIFSVSFE